MCSSIVLFGQSDSALHYLERCERIGEAYPDSLLYYSSRAQTIAMEVGDDHLYLEAKYQEWRYYYNADLYEMPRREIDSLLLVYDDYPNSRLKSFLIAESLVTDALFVQRNQTTNFTDSTETLSNEAQKRFYRLRQVDSFILDSLSLGKLSLAMGILKYQAEDFDSALVYSTDAAKIFQAIENYRLASQSSNLAVASGVMLDKDDVCTEYIPKSEEYAHKSGSVGSIINSKVIKATYYEYMVYDRQKAIEIRAELDSIYQTVPSEAFEGDRALNAKVLYRMEKKEENFEQALRWDNLLDSLSSNDDAAEVRGKMLELNAKYDLATKDKELLESELSRKRLQVSGLILGFGFVLVALLLVLSRMNKRRREDEYKKELGEVINRQEKIAMNAMIDGQNNERERVGKELHDSLGSILATANMTLSSAKENNPSPQLENLEGILQNAVQETRRLSKDLLNGVLTKFGLIVALQDLADDVNRSGLVELRFNAIGMEERLTASHESNIYRVAQELVTNALKHSKAKSIVINLMNRGEEIHLIVKDDGVGGAKDALVNSDGVGWQNIQSRTSLLKGALSVESDAGKGTKIKVIIPAVKEKSDE